MLQRMRIQKRLTVAFILVSAITSVAAIAGCIAMIYMSGKYSYALQNYGFSQGDIGKTISALADARSATRAVIGYTDSKVIELAEAEHEESKASFQQNFSAMEKTLTSPAEEAAYQAAKAGAEKYWKLDEEILTLGNTIDSAKSQEAQARAAAELDPLYDEVYVSLNELMNLNVSTGNELSASLTALQAVLTAVIVGIIIAAMVISFVLGNVIAGGIAKPLAALSERLVTFAKGDLAAPFPESHSQDEVADMVSVAAQMAENLNEIIQDAGVLLEEMANGNYSTHSRIPRKYVGDFAALNESMKKMNLQMNDTLRQIEIASTQVSAGSTNLAEGAQSLAEGATEQAGAIEELQATIVNLTEGVQRTAETVDGSYQEAQKYAQEAENSKGQMQLMVEAMERISDTSEKIGNIISDIEDIASQTNLLSLNAAIEAARAGEAGRGFSVVAEQIRKLAEQSASSAVDTRQLIESAISEVRDGNTAAEKVATTIGEVVDGVKHIAENSRDLQELSHEQAEAMKQAEVGVNQISEVVQANSATAEESSATSEELSAQAITLNELVGKFVLL